MDELDAFFINVKKKTKIIPIAKIYTDKLGDLKEQLLAIRKTFYRETKGEAKREDKLFISWLQVLIERFEKQLK